MEKGGDQGDGGLLQVLGDEVEMVETDGELDEKEYFCSICHKGFRLRNSLNSHKSREHWVQELHCLACGKPFTRSLDLRRHMESHRAPMEALSRAGKDRRMRAITTSSALRWRASASWTR